MLSWPLNWAMFRLLSQTSMARLSPSLLSWNNVSDIATIWLGLLLPSWLDLCCFSEGFLSTLWLVSISKNVKSPKFLLSCLSPIHRRFSSTKVKIYSYSYKYWKSKETFCGYIASLFQPFSLSWVQHPSRLNYVSDQIMQLQLSIVLMFFCLWFYLFLLFWKIKLISDILQFPFLLYLISFEPRIIFACYKLGLMRPWLKFCSFECSCFLLNSRSI